MSVLPPNLIHEFEKGSTELEDTVELVLDSGTVTFSKTSAHGTPILKSISSLLHKLQATFGKTNVSKLDIQLIDRSEWGPIVANNYIKNRRVNRKIGPKGGGSADFYTIFTGLVTDFDIKNEILTIEVRDDLYVAKKKVPEENDTGTQSLKFQNQNPIDIKTTLLQTHGEIPAARIDSAAFTDEKNTWFVGWYFDRVLTRPISIKKLISELDEETFNFTFPDGDKITCATFAPPRPGQVLLDLENEWIKDSLAIKGAMNDNFYNVCVVYYDWDESGSENEENFDNVLIVPDSASQGSSEWDEVARKEIKSKWIRSFTIAQPTNITGVVVYHCNIKNGAGNGTLSYNSTNKTLTWTAPGDSAGGAVTVDKDGKFRLLSNTPTKYIRVVVTVASLPGTDQSDTLAISTLPGDSLANTIAKRWVNRYRDPQAEPSFNLDISNAIHLDKFIRVSDIVKITSDQIITKGKSGWDQEKVFLTSVKPNFEKKRFQVSGIQTAFKLRYGYIGPNTLPDDYDNATEAEREYAFIGDINNEVGTNKEDGYYII